MDDGAKAFEPIALSIVPVVCLGFVGYSVWDLLQERRFKRTAIRTEGQIVAEIPAVNPSMAFAGNHVYKHTNETAAGYLLRVEYDADGLTYSTLTTKAYKKVPSSVGVMYQPDDPEEVVIDRYFGSKVGKYLRLLGSLAFLGISLIPIVYRLMT
jgi:hypothetical protein